jgi:hypothetical protein
MAKSIKSLRELYSFLLGENLVKKLSNEQISLLSKYYGSLTTKEKNKIDDAISKGKSHDLLEIAQSLIEESKQDTKPKKPNIKVNKTKVKLDTKTTPKKSSQANFLGYTNVKNTNISKEEIDERILKIIGLEDVFDIDYDTYVTLLKEKLASARMSKSRIPREEDELIVNEFKRVKGKTGRFKLKSKKISTDKFISRTPVKVSKDKYLLTGKVSLNQVDTEIKKEKKDPLLENVIIIRKSLQNIVSLIETENKINKDNYDKERKSKESEDRKKRESNLEKIKVAGIAAIKKIISPVKDILDKIIHFLTWVILGRAIIKFLDWTSDPKNKSKLKALGKFLENWWPAILGAFVLFATPLGKFIRVVVGTITKFTFQLLRKGIPALQRFLKQKNKPKVTDDSQRRRRGGTNTRVTQSRNAPRFRGGRGGLAGTLAFLGLEAMAPMLSEQVGNFYRSKKIGSYGLSDEELLRQYGIEKSKSEKIESGPLGGLLSQRMDQSRLDILEQELEHRGLAYKSGGEIFSGLVNNYTGLKFSGAGKDTRAFQVLGGGSAVLAPGELVLNEDQQKNIERDTGIDPKMYVSDSKPRQVSGNIKGYNTGGLIGMKSPKTNAAPKISASDYNALLAISALEDDKPQGRSDVAQSLYNRMLAAQKYRVNFNQAGGSLKDLIVAPQQYEPTFTNRNDWINIKDRNSAAFAVMNSAKGKKYRWSLNDALKQLSDTELALKNPALQSKSQKHVGGRAYFLGTSQHGNMKSGDVLRDPTSNFFSPWYLEGTSYDRERRNIAAPIPQMLLPKNNDPKPKPKPKQPSVLDRLGNFASQVGSGIGGLFNSGKGAVAKPVKKEGGGIISGQTRKMYQKIANPFRNQNNQLITQNTGMNLLGKSSGVTDDTQLTLLKKNEYVLTSDFVNHVGVPTLDKLVAYFDSSSTAARLGNKNVNRNIPGPRRRNSGMNIKTLPAVNSPSQMPSSQSKPGSDVPFFPMEPPSSLSKRGEQMAIYGIIA